MIFVWIQAAIGKSRLASFGLAGEAHSHNWLPYLLASLKEYLSVYIAVCTDLLLVYSALSTSLDATFSLEWCIVRFA